MLQPLFLMLPAFQPAPKSENGPNTKVHFENRSEKRVKLYWVGYDNKLKFYADLDPGAKRPQNTYMNNTWLITDASDNPIGFFIVKTSKVARAVIPKQAP